MQFDHVPLEWMIVVCHQPHYIFAWQRTGTSTLNLMFTNIICLPSFPLISIFFIFLFFLFFTSLFFFSFISDTILSLMPGLGVPGCPRHPWKYALVYHQLHLHLSLRLHLRLHLSLFLCHVFVFGHLASTQIILGCHQAEKSRSHIRGCEGEWSREQNRHQNFVWIITPPPFHLKGRRRKWLRRWKERDRESKEERRFFRFLCNYGAVEWLSCLLFCWMPHCPYAHCPFWPG